MVKSATRRSRSYQFMQDYSAGDSPEDSLRRMTYEPHIKDIITLPKVERPEYEDWHTWSCGCKTRFSKHYFNIVYCSETCELYQLVLKGEE